MSLILCLHAWCSACAWQCPVSPEGCIRSPGIGVQVAVCYLVWVLDSGPGDSGKAGTTLKLLSHLYHFLVTPKYKTTALWYVTIYVILSSLFLIDTCIPLEIWVATRDFITSIMNVLGRNYSCFGAVNPSWDSMRMTWAYRKEIRSGGQGWCSAEESQNSKWDRNWSNKQ